MEAQRLARWVQRLALGCLISQSWLVSLTKMPSTGRVVSSSLLHRMGGSREVLKL